MSDCPVCSIGNPGVCVRDGVMICPHRTSGAMRVETIGDATVYLGDCSDIIASLPRVDAIITDPPYGTGYYKTDKDNSVPQVFAMRDAVLAAFGYPEKLVPLCALREPPDEWVVWAPTNKTTRGYGKLPRAHECIAIWGGIKWLPKSDRSSDNWGARITAQRGLDVDERLMGDVWSDAAPGMACNSHLREHPNEKPISVMTRLVKMLTNEGATVLDPFMGSGTTGVACMGLGRKFIGIEIDPKHFDTACRRISAAQAQGRLFA